jgi:drug/metabolite transporter (DMT)-like permease
VLKLPDVRGLVSMSEIWGVLAGLLSNGLGGTAVGVTRCAVGASDPITLGAFRFGIGFVFLLPITLLQSGKWPGRADWVGVTVLGLLFFGLFPILFNAALIFTTATRGALAVSTLPLLSMVVGATLGVEPLTSRKTAGVIVAMLGVSIALVSGLSYAPAGAWKGDLLMVAASFCFALYNVLSRPYIRRSGPIPFTTMAMGIGAVCLIIVAWARGEVSTFSSLGLPQWLAFAYLGIFGSALTFVLWAFALTRTTPTRVAISVPVNPITASLVGAMLLGEPIGWNLIVGLATVFIGIWIAMTNSQPAAELKTQQS